jgi:hypothetical protein
MASFKQGGIGKVFATKNIYCKNSRIRNLVMIWKGIK